MKIWFAFFMYSVMPHASVDGEISLYWKEMKQEMRVLVLVFSDSFTKLKSCPVQTELSLPCGNEIIYFTTCKILLWCVLESAAVQWIVQFCSCSRGLGSCIVFRRTCRASAGWLQLCKQFTVSQDREKHFQLISFSSVGLTWLKYVKILLFK